ncbi:amidohydrolase family protein [Niabella beijingensis]|uniref:amidohydrolase family protein n=1 Tax=Niabella beijingensis TaxID=2872700 RepID=UPI001CBB1AC7|nr:amidohydrolase family protein [Niabella beijingensis]MBZ4189585.1 amidohydrolase family protein [Niabella beijingensis]
MRFFFLISLCFIGLSLDAQPQKDTSKPASSKWEVNNPPGTRYKEVSFQVNEGTWMNLDVSPDGKEVVFDLLGDLYSLPIAGGTARVLRQGLAYEVQPRFSPDGKKILFTSDAGGGDNIWVMNRDGSNARQVTKENFRLLNNAVWSPEGNYFIARKHFTAFRSLGAGEIWMYHINGGEGIQLTKRKNDQQDVNEPSASPDGHYIYYSEDMYPGGFFQYNKDPNNEIYVIKRYDREKGESETITGGGGSAFRPQVSPDGKTLAFVRRVRTKTVLYLRDLETGEEWPVYDKLSKDQQEAWAIFGVYTGFAWMPGGKEIVIWANGKLNRIPVSGSNTATEIPFTCNVTQKIADAIRVKQNLNRDQDTTHVLRGLVTAPDGKYIVYNALGSLWKQELPKGVPVRLTKSADIEDAPAFSKDGRWLTYVGWNDTAMGSIYVMDLAKGNSRRLNIEKGIYSAPSFSPDGKTIVYCKEGGDNVLGNAFNVNTGIYTVDAAGTSRPVRVVDNGSAPYFESEGNHIYFQKGKNLSICKKDGTDEKTAATSTYGSQYIVSPDGNWLAFVDLHKVYIAAFPKTGKTLEIAGGSNAIPVQLVAKDAGYNLHWNANSQELHYNLGNEYFTIPLKQHFKFLNEKDTTTAPAVIKGIPVGVIYAPDRPKGMIAFTNARIITMNGNTVIEKGTVLVEGNILKAVGSGDEVTIPSGAKIIDCAGKTILPGFVDAHAHGNHFRSGITPQKHWPYYTNLAFGVTTMHDPSANSELVFAQSEMIKAGKMVGPRVFSTGTVLYGADGSFKAVINSLDDARSAIRRTKAFGAFSVKSYNQPRREQNQQILTAARELGVMVVPEGGSFFYHNMAMINDGHTTVEHNLPIAVLQDDVIQLWKRSQTAYTPTLIVNYGSVSGEYYWYQHTNVWENEKLLKYTPRAVIDTRSRHRTMLPEEEYENGHILSAKSIRKLADAGVTVNMGAHGQIQGIGAHWEIWMMAQGGMTPLQALQTATINSAKSLGLDDWIGSLQTGKLADLIILDANPLENIRNTESVKYVMVNGRLYDTDTMNETGNYQTPRSKFYWELGRRSSLFNWQDGGGTHLMDTD